MGMIWWILPAVAGVTGLMLLFAGFARFANLKPLSGGTRVLFGVGFLGLAGVIAFASLNLQTYKRLTKERDVAHIVFHEVEGAPGTYQVDMTYSDGKKLLDKDGNMHVLKGDEFELGAQVIKFKPMANMLGYDSIYRLEFIEGRNARRFNTQRVTTATTNGLQLSANPGLDIHNLAKQRGKAFGLEDAQYGSATYQPMGDGYEYSISITQDALVARPSAATRAKIGGPGPEQANDAYVENTPANDNPSALATTSDISDEPITEPAQ